MRISKHIRNNSLRTAAAVFIVLGLLVVALPSAAHAAAPAAIHAADISSGGSDGLPHVQANTNTVRTIMGIAFGIIGAFALLNITLSGFKYITSAGEPQKTSEAKNGIVYSLVGLIIAITAEAIVVFVIKGTGSP